MSREEYIGELKRKLQENDIPNAESMVEFYEEMIADRMEDGMSEEAAVAAMEPIDAILEKAKLDKPLTTLVGEKVKESHQKAEKKGHGALWIALAVLGSPIWLPILLAIVAVLFAVYVLMWALVVAVFAMEAGLAATAVCAFIFAFGVFAGSIPVVTALAAWGSAHLLAGVCILLWYPILGASKGMIALMKVAGRGVKKVFA